MTIWLDGCNSRSVFRLVQTGSPENPAAPSNTRIGIRFAQDVKSDIDGSGPEAGLAIAEIIFPKPAESFRKAHRFDLRPSRQKAFAPVDQGFGVVVAEALRRDKGQAGGLGLS